MRMKNRPAINGFGKKLTHYRKTRGLTQKELGELVGVSNRVIAYYEGETNYPPAHLIVPLAKALSITTDELLGVKASKTKDTGPSRKLLRRIKKIEALPPSQQKVLLRTIDTFLKGAEK
jgi:transcriptional regulator with XRE-family HTH domain